MALFTVRGIYRDGKVELAEQPSEAVESSEVLVTFLPAEQPGEAGVTSEESRRAAGERFLARLKQGVPFGGPPYPKRDGNCAIGRAR